jgi:hypothetical protein
LLTVISFHLFSLVKFLPAVKLIFSTFSEFCSNFFLINLFIFVCQYKSINYFDNPLDKANWMGPADSALTGFTWRKGSKRATSGIVVWSDVFLHTSDIGEKLAIVLTDTQGLFDSSVSDFYEKIIQVK